MRHELPGRRGATGRPSLRGFSLLAVVVVGAASAVALAGPGPRASAAVPRAAQGLDTGGPVELVVSWPSYTAAVTPGSDLLTIWREGHVLRLPLVALVGRQRLPPGDHFAADASGNSLTVEAVDRWGSVLERATVQAEPSYLEVSFSSQLGPERAASPEFFTNGDRGLPESAVEHGFTPDPVGPSLRPDPQSFLGVHRPLVSAPFAPPPFDVELHASIGWLGFGLVHIPDATGIGVTSTGAVEVDYPLSLLATFRNSGAGGRVASPGAGAAGTWLSFPAFVLTMASDPYSGLSAYRTALVALHQAPVADPPGSRPSWWAWPLVDTWGQQSVMLAARTSHLFDTAWVKDFVQTWRSRFGVDHFTVVIDSQWQEKLGSPQPSSRFGGVAGMRRLIDQLHQEGLRVLLWWPMWIDQKSPQHRYRIDPTAAYFPARIRHDMTVVLGRGPRDLDADGLKLDWGYLVPSLTRAHYADPKEGVGAAALLRYMTFLSKDAWRVHPRALLDASAMAPQFGGTEDALRLYDARLASTWAERAAIVARVDPDSLIDGDGWQVDSSTQAVAHIIGSAVFGIPAIYYATRWSGGEPISSSLAKALGAVVSSAESRGQGVPVSGRGGTWRYYVDGRLSAQTLANDTALAIYHYRLDHQLDRITVVGAVAADVRLQLGRSLVVGSTSASDRALVRFTRPRGYWAFRALPGVVYQLRIRRR